MLMIDFIAAVIAQTFWVLYEGGVFIVLGFAVAGLIHVALDPERIVRRLGERSVKSALFAALLGAPLPLCSCGVLPTATLLRRKGASREATLSFLITTPETGIDSIAATFAFLGPLLAIVRPIIAALTGLLAASLSLRRWPPHLPEPRGETFGTTASLKAGTETAEHDVHDHAVGNDRVTNATPRERVLTSIRSAAHYAFVDLFDELGFSLAFAIVLTGVLSALLPQDFFARFLPTSFLAMVAMVVLSIPLYVCASASTPLAALFVAKGASAGAALVFLLVGPATNAATIATVGRLLGRSTLPLYVGSIVGVAIAAGLILDLSVPGLGKTISIGPPAGPETFATLKLVSAVALVGLIIWSLTRTGVRPGFAELSSNVRAAVRWARGLEAHAIVTSRALQGLAVLWLITLLARGFVSVPLGTEALRQRLGAVRGQPIGPGLAYAVPLVDRIDIVGVDQVRELQIGYTTDGTSLERNPVPNAALYLTADENVIDLHAEVQYRVSDPVRYRLGVEDPGGILSGLVRGRLVEAIAGHSIDVVYTNARAEVEAWLLAHVREDVAKVGLGVDILATRLLDVHAPREVHDAFRDVASAHEDRLTTIHQAEAYAVAAAALVRGEAESKIAAAEAGAAAELDAAHGKAGAFTALAAEHSRSPRLTEERMYIETCERVLPGARKIVRPAWGTTKGYELWLTRNGGPTLIPTPVAPTATPATTQAAQQPAPPADADPDTPPSTSADEEEDQ
jgi:HflK protein